MKRVVKVLRIILLLLFIREFTLGIDLILAMSVGKVFLTEVVLNVTLKLTKVRRCSYETAGVPEENPRMHGENMQTPHRTWNPLAVRRRC